MELLLAMKTLIYLTVLSAVLVPVLGDSLERCPHIVRQENHFVKTFGEKCYMFINTEMYWTAARKYCWDLGGDMLEVDDEGTMIFIRSVLNGRELGWRRNGVWIGAHDRRTEGHWTWASGRPIKYSYWSSGQPSSILGTGLSVEDCACMVRRNAWKWHDYPCELLNWKYNFICQFPYAKGGSDTSYHTGAHNPENDDKGVIVAYILGCVCFLILIMVVVFIFYCRRRKKKPSQDDEPPQFENLSYAQLRQAEINENNANMSCFTANQMNSLYEEVNKPVDHGVNYYTNMTGAGACGGPACPPKVTNIEAASKENNATNEKVLEQPQQVTLVNNQLYDVDKDTQSSVPLTDKHHDDDHVYEDMQ